MTDKIEDELNAAYAQLRESTGALAKLGSDYEKARREVQAQVTRATNKISALLTISNAQKS